MDFLSDDEIRAILDDLVYPGFDFRLVRIGVKPPPTLGGDDIVALQIICYGRDNVSGAALTWKSRKWLLSRHMRRGEIVQTAFLAVITAIEHEAREVFTYRGRAVFDPHYDIDKLHALRGRPDALAERPLAVRSEDLPAMTAVEGHAGPDRDQS